MNSKIKQKTSFLFFIFLLLVMLSPVFAQETVRAKIGIEILSGDRSVLAKSKARIKVGDQLRVYIIPEVDSHVYVIYSDQKDAVLLNPSTDEQLLSKGNTKIFPSKVSLYEPDGKQALDELLREQGQWRARALELEETWLDFQHKLDTLEQDT